MLETGRAPDAPTTPAYPAVLRDALPRESKAAGVRFWPDIIAKDVVVAADRRRPARGAGTLRRRRARGPGRPERRVVHAAARVVLPAVLPAPEARARARWRAPSPSACRLLLVLVAPAASLLRPAQHAVVPAPSASRPRRSAAMTAASALLLRRIGARGADDASRPKSGDRCRRWSARDARCSSAAVRRLSQGRGPEGGEEEGGRARGHARAHRGRAEAHAAWMHSFIEDPARFHPDSKMPALRPADAQPSGDRGAGAVSGIAARPTDATRQPEFRDTFPEPVKSKEKTMKRQHLARSPCSRVVSLASVGAAHGGCAGAGRARRSTRRTAGSATACSGRRPRR